MKRILFYSFVFLSLSATAQEVTDTTEMLPVEVRAVRASATAPFAKTNISRREISPQNLGQDLPFLLNYTPSVVVNSDAGNGVGYTGIRIRGTDATRINMTLNGIPYNDAESQGLFFVNLPDFASSVNSIQVQRGVGTSTNGPGAFGATINFSTNEVNKIPYAELNNSYGSFNTWKNTIRAGSGLLGGHFTTDLRLSRISSDGFIDRASTDLKSFYFSTAYLGDKTDLRLNIFSGKEKTYQAWYGITEDDLVHNRTVNYAGTEKPGAPYDNETDNYQQDHYQLFLTHRIKPDFSFNIAGFLTRGRGYYEQYKAEQDYANYRIPYPVYGTSIEDTTDLVRQLWLDNYFYGGIFSLQRQAAKRDLTLGGSLTQYDGKHYGKVIWAEKGSPLPNHYYDLTAFKNDFTVYGKWQEHISSSFLLFGDLQYRRVAYELNGFRDNPSLRINNTYQFINPKFGLTIRRGHYQGYASFSVANKEPNRDDFEAGMEQQPRAEKLKDWELGLEYRKGSWSWSVNGYYMDYKDQLVLTGKINDVGAYTRTNIDNSYRLGLELQGGAQPYKWMKVDANLTLSRNRILDFTEYLDDYDNGGQKTNEYSSSEISFSPSVVASAGLTILPVKNGSISFLSKYVSKQYLDNTGNETRKLDAYFTEDLRMMYSFNRHHKIDLILQLNNLFNSQYEPNGYTYSYYETNNLYTQNSYFPMAGFNGMVGVNIRL